MLSSCSKPNEPISSFAKHQGHSHAIYNSWPEISQYVNSNGLKLAVDIIRPAKNGKVTQKLPAIVMQTPYHRAFGQQ